MAQLRCPASLLFELSTGSASQSGRYGRNLIKLIMQKTCRIPLLYDVASSARRTGNEMTLSHARMLFVAFAILCGLSSPSLGDRSTPASEATAWQIAKCRFYEETWRDMIAHYGSEILTPEFRDENERFIRSTCLQRIPVCPRSSEDLAIANALTLGTMNGDVGGSFLPFACK